MIVLAACFVVAVVAAFFYIQRLHAEHLAEREAWRVERRELLNRIQAPERAPIETFPEPSDEPLYVPPLDDGAWEAYVEQRKEGRVS